MTQAVWYPGDRVAVNLAGEATVVTVSGEAAAVQVRMDEPDFWHPRTDGRGDVVWVAERHLTRIDESGAQA